MKISSKWVLGHFPQSVFERLDIGENVALFLIAGPMPWVCARQTVEHPFGTLKAWMGSTHFLTKTLGKVRTEMSLHVLAYNMKRMIRILGVRPLMEAIAT